MKKVIAVAALSLTAALAGCGQGTSGGPGASTPPSKPNVLGQDENTFSLAITSTAVRQGEKKDMLVGISRGKNFSEDVALKFAGLPVGVSVAPAAPGIKHSATESTVTLTAAPDAALGDFTVTVTGHPAKGADAVTEVKLSVDKADAAKAVDAAEERAEDKLVVYADTMQPRLDVFEKQFEALQERAENAEGQAKSDLDVKVATAQVKLDEAEERLKELREAGPDRVESAKTALNEALAQLKTALE